MTKRLFICYVNVVLVSLCGRFVAVLVCGRCGRNFSASEVTTLWRYTNLFIIIIIIMYPRLCILIYQAAVHRQWRSASLSRSGWSNFWFLIIGIGQYVSTCKITSLYVQQLRFSTPWLTDRQTDRRHSSSYCMNSSATIQPAELECSTDNKPFKQS